MKYKGYELLKAIADGEIKERKQSNSKMIHNIHTTELLLKMKMEIL